MSKYRTSTDLFKAQCLVGFMFLMFLFFFGIAQNSSSSDSGNLPTNTATVG